MVSHPAGRPRIETEADRGPSEGQHGEYGYKSCLCVVMSFLSVGVLSKRIGSMCRVNLESEFCGSGDSLPTQVLCLHLKPAQTMNSLSTPTLELPVLLVV